MGYKMRKSFFDNAWLLKTFKDKSFFNIKN